MGYAISECRLPTLTALCNLERFFKLNQFPEEYSFIYIYTLIF